MLMTRIELDEVGARALEHALEHFGAQASRAVKLAHEVGASESSALQREGEAKLARTRIRDARLRMLEQRENDKATGGSGVGGVVVVALPVSVVRVARVAARWAASKVSALATKAAKLGAMTGSLEQYATFLQSLSDRMAEQINLFGAYEGVEVVAEGEPLPDAPPEAEDVPEVVEPATEVGERWNREHRAGKGRKGKPDA